MIRISTGNHCRPRSLSIGYIYTLGRPLPLGSNCAEYGRPRSGGSGTTPVTEVWFLRRAAASWNFSAGPKPKPDLCERRISASFPAIGLGSEPSLSSSSSSSRGARIESKAGLGSMPNGGIVGGGGIAVGDCRVGASGFVDGSKVKLSKRPIPRSCQLQYIYKRRNILRYSSSLSSPLPPPLPQAQLWGIYSFSLAF